MKLLSLVQLLKWVNENKLIETLTLSWLCWCTFDKKLRNNFRNCIHLEPFVYLFQNLVVRYLSLSLLCKLKMSGQLWTTIRINLLYMKMNGRVSSLLVQATWRTESRFQFIPREISEWFTESVLLYCCCCYCCVDVWTSCQMN